MLEIASLLPGFLKKSAHRLAIVGRNDGKETINGRRCGCVHSEQSPRLGCPFHTLCREVPRETAGFGQRLHLVEGATKRVDTVGQVFLRSDVRAEGDDLRLFRALFE